MIEDKVRFVIHLLTCFLFVNFLDVRGAWTSTDLIVKV